MGEALEDSRQSYSGGGRERALRQKQEGSSHPETHGPTLTWARWHWETVPVFSVSIGPPVFG